MSRAEKVGLGVAVFGVAVTIVFGALSLAGVRMSEALVSIMVGIGVVLMIGGFGFATASWLTGRRGLRAASQPSDNAPRPSPAVPSQGFPARSSRQVRQTEQNAPQRPVLPSVPDPPPLADPLVNSGGVRVDQGRLKSRLNAQLTLGWELLGDLSSADKTEDVIAARKALRDWAERLRAQLEEELGLDHADYFITASPVEYRSELYGSRLLAEFVKGQLGGEHKMRLIHFTNERLARLSKIVGQL